MSGDTGGERTAGRCEGCRAARVSSEDTAGDTGGMRPGPRTAGQEATRPARLPLPGELLSLRKDFHLIWFLLK